MINNLSLYSMEFLQLKQVKQTTNRKSDMKGKQIWAQEEDTYLKQLVSDAKNTLNWASMAEKINVQFPNKVRSSKQCRERYVNHLYLTEGSHSINDWTLQQNNSLFLLFQKWGSRWTKISQQIKGKSQNCVKNRFYGSLRKALRKMNRAAKNLVKKFKKEVKYESITRIIDASEGLFRLQSPLKEQSQQLTRKILCLAKRTDQQMPTQQAQQLIIEINKFNMATRSYKSKKKIKNQNSSCKKDKNGLALLIKSEPSQSLNKQSCSNMEIEANYQNSKSTEEEIQSSPQMVSSQKRQIQAESDHDLYDGLRDFMQLDGQLNVEGVRDGDNLQDLFTEVHSPLEGELWI